MAWQAALSALGSAGGGILSGYFNNRESESRQHQAGDFEQLMRATQYQTVVKDLQAAGLNPMLAYSNGAGSTPSMSAAGSAGMGNFGSDAVDAYNNSRIASAQEANINANTLKATAETRNTEADTLYKLGLPELLTVNIMQARNSAENTAVATKKLNAEIDQVTMNIENLKTQIQKNKSDINLQNQLAQSQIALRNLYTAQSYLFGQQSKGHELQNLILDPKARIASTPLGENAARSSAYGESMWGWLPKLSGGGFSIAK